MKRIVSFFLLLMVVLSLSGCQGNYESIDFKDAIVIDESGIIKDDILEQLKNDNAIANFVGEYGQYQYEWLIFGTDITNTEDINLALAIEEKSENEIEISFAEEKSFEYPMFLSITLDKKWNAQSATLYDENVSVGTVSMTGSQNSILNINVLGLQGAYVIRAEDEQEEDTSVQTQIAVEVVNKETVNEEVAVKEYTKQESIQQEKEDYLAKVEDVSDKVYLSDASPDSGVVFAPSNSTEVIGKNAQAPEKDTYLSNAKSSNGRVYSSGSTTKKDKYETDPIPEGKPMPVEPENQEISTQITHTCTFSIECTTILNNLEDLNEDKRELIPSDGVILAPTEVTFYEGESVYDVLMRVCKENGIHMEASWTPIYNSAYIEGIHNLYEFDCGELSGWMYRVNGWYPNYGCSRYQLVDGEVVEWRFTCDLGRDVNCNWMG